MEITAEHVRKLNRDDLKFCAYEKSEAVTGSYWDTRYRTVRDHHDSERQKSEMTK